MTYTAGPCSVCGEAGDALFVMCATTGRIFFYCPACGCAWDQPPKICVVDTIDPITLFAPNGIRLPTAGEIKEAELEYLIKGVYPDSSDDRVEEHIARF
jgi:hypothetical protein